MSYFKGNCVNMYARIKRDGYDPYNVFSDIKHLNVKLCRLIV